jgi:hypothetical protein
MVGFGGWIARFRELKEDEWVGGAVSEAVEWLGLFFFLVVVLWIVK